MMRSRYILGLVRLIRAGSRQASRRQQVTDSAPHVVQRRPQAIVQLFDPGIDGDETEPAIVIDSRAGELARHFDDMRIVHADTPVRTAFAARSRTQFRKSEQTSFVVLRGDSAMATE